MTVQLGDDPALPEHAEDPPRVVAAAILGPDGAPVSLPPPARHHDVIRHMAVNLGHETPITGEQGFLLSDGTFARRALARMFAELNEQLLPRAGGTRELYSEDVW
jgi:hypothetical protein